MKNGLSFDVLIFVFNSGEFDLGVKLFVVRFNVVVVSVWLLV